MFRILLGHVDTSLRGGLDVRMGEHERGTEAYSEDRTASSTAPYENSGISTQVECILLLVHRFVCAAVSPWRETGFQCR